MKRTSFVQDEYHHAHPGCLRRKQGHLSLTIALLLSILVFTTQKTHAEEWIDVTDAFIVNPSFEGNSNSGWSYVSDAGSRTVRCECMEFWNGTFNIYQNLTGLTPGKYRLSVQAYYRCRDNNNGYPDYQNGTENITAEMYAGETAKPLVSVYSFHFDDYVDGTWQYGNWWEGGEMLFFPNTMESAHEAFERGEYMNIMEFETTESSILIGLRNSEHVNDNWCIFDNFRLEYWGSYVEAEDITITPTSLELLPGETAQAVAAVRPDNTTDKKVTWMSDDESIAIVDASGMVSARNAGTTTITAMTKNGLTASLTVTVKSALPSAESLIINELMAANTDGFVGPTWNFTPWAELYNPTNATVALGGLWFSDDAANLQKWQAPAYMGIVPAHGFKTIWFDDPHLSNTNIPFKLDVDGGTLYISSPDGKLITSQDYPAAIQRVAYARKTDGGNEWGLTAEPTPGRTNSTSAFALAQLPAPTVDVDSRLFEGELHISVSFPEGARLRYTTDGSLPTLEGGKVSTTGLFTVTKTTNYRFRVFRTGYLPSDVTTRSYILRDRDYMLPVVSVVSESAFLYSDSIGVMVRGTNGRTGNGQSSPCNWNMDWERPVNFSYILPDGETMALNQDVYLEMAGGWSRAYSPHSFKLKGNKSLGGDKNLNYPFFSAKPYIRNRTLQIRNGGNDTGCRIKDAAIQTIIQTSGIDIDNQSYQPVHEFVNGTYMGVLNVREPNNKHYVYANYGWDDDEIDQFEMSPDSGYVQKCGSYDSFKAIYDLSEHAADPVTYQEIKERLDIDEYINYMAMELYLGSDDWPRNNAKGFAKAPDGKYRLVSYDIDFAFNTTNSLNAFEQKQYWTFDLIYDTGQRITKEIELVTVFLNLLNNDEFRQQFIDTYSVMGGSVFEAERCTQVIDSLTAIVGPAMALNGGSPYSTANQMKSSFNNLVQTMTNTLKNYWRMGLTDKTARSADISANVGAARLFINDTPIPTGVFKGRLFAPTRLKAVAPAGYRFKGWLSSGALNTPLFEKGSEWKYYDQGSLDNTGWSEAGYDDANWAEGYAPLGYSKDGLATVVSYGNNSQNKYPTCYFRRSFNLSKAPTASTHFTMNYTIDDGFVVYVNGKEAGRYNMPSGTPSFNTLSTTYANGNPDVGSVSLSPSLFKRGTNVIAVEVHNNSVSSTDLMWDANLMTDMGEASTDYYSTEAEVDMPDQDFILQAVFEEQGSEELKAQGINPVRINEVSASNDIYVNDYFKKNDWVELYNTTGKDINVEGMYLTDNLQNMTKFQIARGESNASTIIPAHGFLLVWCDKLESNSELHADFKLASEGGAVALTASDKAWADTLAYPAHDGNTTVGRYPDGGNDVYVMTVPTIRKANLYNSYMTLYKDTTIQTGMNSQLVASANGLRIRYASGMLCVKAEQARSVDVDVCTLSGQMVTRVRANVRSGRADIPVRNLAPGCYVARATDNNGNSVSCKFIK